MATETETGWVLKAVAADHSDHSACSKSTGSDPALNSMRSATRVRCPELGMNDISLAQKIPYSVGFTTIATRHEPHGPFGPGYLEKGPPISGDQDALSQVDYCLCNPSIGGNMLYQDTTVLKITAVIRTSQGAQLVVVNNDMVAKIYDQLFYDDSNTVSGDVVYTANSDYCREAAAYEELQKSQAAQEVMPAFYGTWVVYINTLRREEDQVWKYTRQVPLILIEHVRGITMADINPRVLSEPTRSRILRKVLEIDSVLFHAGVRHGDINPRNAIVVELRGGVDLDAQEEAIVKVIDFNSAVVRLHPNYHHVKVQHRIEKEIQAWQPKLPSPLIRFHHSLGPFVWEGWCPNDDPEFDDQGSSQWLWKQFKDDERYIPVIYDPADPHTRPEYVKFDNTSLDSSYSGGDMVGVEKTSKRKWCEG